MTTLKPLAGHTSFETAYIVPDYPYGFRLRCKIAYWIETNKHGSRFWSRTTNPKKVGPGGADIWNKPKASTYSPVLVMGLDENDHVKTTSVRSWASDAEIDAFIETYGEALTPPMHVALKRMKAANAMMSKVEFVIVKDPAA